MWTDLTDPAELDRWAPFTANDPSTAPGGTTLTMVDGDERSDLPATIVEVEKPRLLACTRV